MIKIKRAKDPEGILELLSNEIRQDYMEMYDGDESEMGEFPPYLLKCSGELYIAIVDGDLAGCGGWVWVDALGYTFNQVPEAWGELRVAEVKRVFVRNEYRRKGIASAIDEAIFAGAFEAGADLVVGETGRAQLASQAMRINQPGMIPVEPFGKYYRDLGSLFFGKVRN